MRTMIEQLNRNGRLAARMFVRDYFAPRSAAARWVTALPLTVAATGIIYALGLGGRYGDLVLTDAQFGLTVGLTVGMFDFFRQAVSQLGLNSNKGRLVGEAVLMITLAGIVSATQVWLG